MDTIVEEIFSGRTFLLMFISYAVGALPVGLILTKWKTGKNIKQIGSGNIGATNAGRAAGPVIGIATLFLDMVKGYLPASVAISLGASIEIAALCGLCSVIGHCFPIWLRFSGGKGVSTAFGALILIYWPLALYGLLGFFVGYILLKQVGGGSLLGSLTVSVSGFFLLESVTSKIIVIIMCAIVVARHENNIMRLMRGGKI